MLIGSIGEMSMGKYTVSSFPLLAANVPEDAWKDGPVWRVLHVPNLLSTQCLSRGSIVDLVMPS
jgi:hypothetical protein